MTAATRWSPIGDKIWPQYATLAIALPVATDLPLAAAGAGDQQHDALGPQVGAKPVRVVAPPVRGQVAFTTSAAVVTSRASPGRRSTTCVDQAAAAGKVFGWPPLTGVWHPIRQLLLPIWPEDSPPRDGLLISWIIRVEHPHYDLILVAEERKRRPSAYNCRAP